MQIELPYKSRYIDVLAISHASLNTDHECTKSSVGISGVHSEEALLVVPLDHPYSPSGPGVVSKINIQHVRYNGIEFWKLSACLELQKNPDPLIRAALPPSLTGTGHLQSSVCSDEPIQGSESIKCAPENRVIRRPVSHFTRGMDTKPRYPQRNVLNAKFEKPPQNPDPWCVAPIYSEPPFPIFQNAATFSA